MTTTSGASRRAPIMITLLTVVWLLAIPALLLRLYALGWESWADHYSDGDRSAEIARRADVVLLLLAAVTAGGPVLIAVVAFANRLVRTGAVYLALAVLLGAAAAPAAAGAYRDLKPPAPPPVTTGGCQEHSGGDNRCPGG